jgi:dienelactone hydrolase
MRQDVEFQADGPRLRGWLYTPDAGAPPFATVVMAHGFSAVKEMYLDRFAEAFAEAGLAALVFDNRNFVGEGFQQASRAASEWFAQHLLAGRVPAPVLVTA